MISAGKYLAHAATHEMCSSEKAPYVKVTLTVSSGESIEWYGSFSETKFETGGCVADRTVDALLLMGWDGDDLVVMRGLGSAEVQIVVVEEPNREGKVFPKVKYINPPGGNSSAKPVEKSELAKLNQAMRGKVLKRKQELTAKGQAPVAAPKPVVGDFDFVDEYADRDGAF